MENSESIPVRLLKQTGVDVTHCYQCGKCTAGCVLASEMDYPSSYVMRLLQTDDRENYQQVLHSNAIWLCLNCENCIARCPMEIDIPKIMDYLRAESLKAGYVNKKAKPVVAFHRAFLDSIKYTGRLYEVGLVAGFKARTFRITQDLKVAPVMYLKGKLNLMPEMVKDLGKIKSIFSKTVNNKNRENK